MSVIYPRPGNVSTIYIGTIFWGFSVKPLGGIDSNVDEAVIYEAFIGFGDIKEVFIPRDNTADGGHRGFAFVEYEKADDAKSAVDNMHLNELKGLTIRCNMARPTRVTTGGIHTAAGRIIASSLLDITCIVWELEAAAGGDTIEEPIAPEQTEDASKSQE